LSGILSFGIEIFCFYSHQEKLMWVVRCGHQEYCT
jgi:hypothetical protein